MGFASLDSLISAISAGQSDRHDGSKLTTPVHTAGGWHALFGLAGYPNATTYPGTDLLFRACTAEGGDGTAFPGIPLGGPVEGTPGMTKHLTALSALPFIRDFLRFFRRRRILSSVCADLVAPLVARVPAAQLATARGFA